MLYSHKLRVNIEMAKSKINTDLETNTADAQKPLKQHNRNSRSSFEDIFRKGKRLPVFSYITIDSDPIKKS